MWRRSAHSLMDPPYHLHEMTRPAPPTAATTPLPRGLIVLSCLWIGGSWLENIGINTPIQPIAEDYSYGLQMLCSSLLIGITLGWPLMRLATSHFTRPVRQTLLDMSVVGSGILVTIWPLRLLSSWSVEQTILITGVLISWTLVVGGLICLGSSSDRSAVRSTLILGLFCFIGIGAMLPKPETLSWWRPVDVILEITLPRNTDILEPGPYEAVRALTQTVVAAAGIWLIVIGRNRLRSCSGRAPA